MITFKDFLTESRDAPLYHGTRWAALLKILTVGIEPRTNQNITKLYGWTKKGMMRSGVSVARNFRFARSWSGGPVIELDGRLLHQAYKMVPFQYWSHTARVIPTNTEMSRDTHNETEEFIITDKPIPPKYFKHILVPEKSIYGIEARPILDEIREKFGSQFIRTY